MLLANVMTLDMQDIQNILEMILFEFPIKQIDLQVPQWIEALSEDHWLIKEFLNEIAAHTQELTRMRDH